MSLHTARKKVDELTNEELDKELNSANRLFVDLNWRYEYNRRVKPVALLNQRTFF